MIAADGEANKNKNKQKVWWLVSYKFYKKYFQDLKYIVKEVYIGIYFLFDFHWHYIHFDIVCKK